MQILGKISDTHNNFNIKFMIFISSKNSYLFFKNISN